MGPVPVFPHTYRLLNPLVDHDLSGQSTSKRLKGRERAVPRTSCACAHLLCPSALRDSDLPPTPGPRESCASHPRTRLPLPFSLDSEGRSPDSDLIIASQGLA